MPWPNEERTETVGFWVVIGFLLVALLAATGAEARTLNEGNTTYNETLVTDTISPCDPANGVPCVPISPHAYMPPQARKVTMVPSQEVEQIAIEGLWHGILLGVAVWFLVLFGGFARYYWYKGIKMKGAFYEEFVKKQEDD